MRSYFFQTECGGFHPDLLSVLDARPNVTVDCVGMAFHRENVTGVSNFGWDVHTRIPSDETVPGTRHLVPAILSVLYRSYRASVNNVLTLERHLGNNTPPYWSERQLCVSICDNINLLKKR